MSYLDRGAVRLRFDVIDQVSEAVVDHVVPCAADRPTLVFTTGFGATSHMFAATAAALAPMARVVTWDLRGHGGTESPLDPAAYTLDAAVDDLLALCDHVDSRPVVLGGHSLGGYVSLEAARRHPERVAGLVLVGTGPGFRDEAARERWNQMVERIATRIETRGRDGLGRGDEVDASRHRSLEALVLAARGILVQHDARVLDALPTITVPSLVVVGEHDDAFHAGAAYLAAKLPDARHVVIAGAGHAPNVTHPEPFERAVREFLWELVGSEAPGGVTP